MKTGTVLFILLPLVLFGCNSIEEFDDDERVVTRKFGPSDLKELGSELMDRLEASKEDWMKDKPRLAIADFRNKTDKPGLNKQPFFDVIETALFRMKRFKLIDHQETRQLIEEVRFQGSDHYNSETAARMGRAIGAKFIMWGDISSIVDTDGSGRQIKQYRLSLKVTCVETHDIVYRDFADAKMKAVD